MASAFRAKANPLPAEQQSRLGSWVLKLENAPPPRPVFSTSINTSIQFFEGRLEQEYSVYPWQPVGQCRCSGGNWDEMTLQNYAWLTFGESNLLAYIVSCSLCRYCWSLATYTQQWHHLMCSNQTTVYGWYTYKSQNLLILPLMEQNEQELSGHTKLICLWHLEQNLCSNM